MKSNTFARENNGNATDDIFRWRSSHRFSSLWLIHCRQKLHITWNTTKQYTVNAHSLYSTQLVCTSFQVQFQQLTLTFVFLFCWRQNSSCVKSLLLTIKIKLNYKINQCQRHLAKSTCQWSSCKEMAVKLHKWWRVLHVVNHFNGITALVLWLTSTSKV